MASFALVAVVATWVSSYFSAENRLKRTLRDVKVWPIGELPENTLGRVIGEAQPVDRVLRSPLTGRPCVFYVARVEEDNRGSWTPLFTERESVPFLLADPSGHAIVDPSCADVALTFDRDSRSGTFDDPTPSQEAFLEKHGHVGKGWIFNKKLRYVEAVIEPGERVAILGSGIREPDPKGLPSEGYRSAPPTRLRLTSSPQYPLAISDDPLTTSAAVATRPL
jgi:hypothetical protein